jgi:hypothetical protein
LFQSAVSANALSAIAERVPPILSEIGQGFQAEHNGILVETAPARILHHLTAVRFVEGHFAS